MKLLLALTGAAGMHEPSVRSPRQSPPHPKTELSLPLNDALLANRLKVLAKAQKNLLHFFKKKLRVFFYLHDSAFLTFHGVSSLSPLSTHEGSLQALLPGCRDDGVLSAEGPRHRRHAMRDGHL